jgi:hypothetical protein
VDEQTRLDAELDPCPGRTRHNAPCERPRHHVGHCGASPERHELYRQYIANVRERANRMTREEIASAVEFHLIAWRVLRNEYNGR